MKWTISSVVLALAAAAVWLAGIAAAGDDKGSMGFNVYTPTEVKWEAGPASLPPGAKIALLEGNPAKEGPFVLRLSLPDGYRIAPHTHPKRERVTVISGRFHIGMGDKFDPAKGTAMPAGSFGTWAAGMKHYAWSTGETVIQLHGTGPWTIEYVNPADDPRNAKK
jgi:ChrR-like protein with cupin domain